jgi:phenylpropionate dioxygenase-like ring-hydroxylating dioxygenase large terminal subunit
MPAQAPVSHVGSAQFLPSWVYGDRGVAERERSHYARRCWHAALASGSLAGGDALALELLGVPLLLTRAEGADAAPRAFLNRCPHRGVALLAESPAAQPCRRLVCPYHGWTYDLHGQLLAAAREGEFLEPFERGDWPLQELPCRQLGPLIWVALAADPLPLEQQLDLLLAEAGDLFLQPRQLLARERRPLACNWKIAHDNTLDDYHVAIAHPTTLHREQGPVRDYRHSVSAHGNLLTTPHGDGGNFHTFGLAPWTHLLLWPDQRLALINFLPQVGRGAVPDGRVVAGAAVLRQQQRQLDGRDAALSRGGPAPGGIGPTGLCQWPDARTGPPAGATDPAVAGALQELDGARAAHHSTCSRSQAAIAPLISSKSATGWRVKGSCGR